MKKGKKKCSAIEILLCLVFFIGTLTLLYPYFSDAWNRHHQSEVIGNYENTAAGLDPEEIAKILEQAAAYNRRLLELEAPLADYLQADLSGTGRYEDQLNIQGNGVMGYLEIPKIKVRLPVYHGTSGTVLNSGVGHLQGSTLPIGGEGTHSVLAAHCGLPSSKLFSELNHLKEGDQFTIVVPGRTLIYQVDQIAVVLPEETEKLRTEEGKDYCTLLTCTPYGLNTHRLLVRGMRKNEVANSNENSGA